MDPRWMLAAYGVTFLLCDARLIARARVYWTARSPFLKGLLECYACTGAWVSGALSCGWALRIGRFDVVDIAVDAMAGSAFCYAFNAAVLAAEAHRDRRD